MTVITKYGEIRGLKKEGCNVYLGIPFAAPPVGELAFRHPVPPSPWNGMLEATSGFCNPIQAKGGFYTGNNSQDCLYLNASRRKKHPLPCP